MLQEVDLSFNYGHVYLKSSQKSYDCYIVRDMHKNKHKIKYYDIFIINIEKKNNKHK